MSRLWEIGKWMWSTVMPEFCVGCGKRYEMLCERCWAKVEFVYEQQCPECGEGAIGGATHPKCLKRNGLDGLWCVTVYKGPVKTLIHHLKYAYATSLVVLIEQLIFKYTHHESILLPPAILLPVPLHKRSQMKRGFNQSEMVADCLSKALGYPVIKGVVKKVRQTASQTTLDKKGRQLNVQGCFELDLPNGSQKEVVQDKVFIVVDDVVTSGSTMNEVAGVLKKAGAAKVYGFGLARD